jgi:hypothetical protein
MKTKFFKNILLSVLSLFIVSWVVYWALGWWEWVENADTGESLTATVWNSLVDGVVKKTWSVAETITWIKTFSSSPIVPSPTASGEVSSKGYVDDIPAFKVRINSSQSINNVTDTKIQFNQEDFDTHDWFDSSTNYRYTPQKPWYYYFHSNTMFDDMTAGYSLVRLRKNWSSISESNKIQTADVTVHNSTMLYMNGTTDYVEVTVSHSSWGTRNLRQPTFFEWFYIRN